jgi:arylsulfatase A-like enzyme
MENLHERSLRGALTPEEQRILEDRYDEEIVSADRKIAMVVDVLERLGLRDKTLLIVTADHGEVMAESSAKQFGHGTLDYGCLRVPLVMSFPGRIGPGKRVEAVTQTIDITPTVIDLMDLRDQTRRQGDSLASLLAAGEDPALADAGRQAYATGDIETRDEYAVLTADWQYVILGDSVSLYDIRGASQTASAARTASASTPERLDVAGQYPSVADSLQTAVEAWIKRCLAEAVVPYSLKGRSVAPGREALERLKALGYIQ